MKNTLLSDLLLSYDIGHSFLGAGELTVPMSTSQHICTNPMWQRRRRNGSCWCVLARNEGENYARQQGRKCPPT